MPATLAHRPSFFNGLFRLLREPVSTVQKFVPTGKNRVNILTSSEMKTKLGKFVWLAAAGLGFIAIVTVLLDLRPSDDIQQSLADTRQSLRAQGVKTDLTDFDLAAAGDLRARANDLLSGASSLPYTFSTRQIDLLPTADTESVAVLWQLDYVPGADSALTWQSLGDTLDPLAPILDANVGTVLAGPYQFDINLHGGPGLRLVHLTGLLKLSTILAARTMLDLHETNDAAAWTNLEAVTRLATGWQTEPIEISQLVRANLVNNAFATTWQALQNHAWSDDQLAALQQTWTGIDYFQSLPDALAFQGAMTVKVCQDNRMAPLSGRGPMIPGVPPVTRPRSPTATLAEIYNTWQEARYRGYGTYADEKNLLLFNRDRVAEARAAIQATNWLQMEALPGVTNTATFKSPYPSRIQATLQNTLGAPGIRRIGRGAFARAAVTETRRLLLITTLALERYRLRHHTYPADLSDLTPDFLPTVPIDFMDGNPLRYHPTADGYFLLYSVGLDGVDDGGTLKSFTTNPIRSGIIGFFGTQDIDIVWPRPATDWQMKSMNQAASLELLQQTNAPGGP